MGLNSAFKGLMYHLHNHKNYIKALMYGFFKHGLIHVYINCCFVLLRCSNCLC